MSRDSQPPLQISVLYLNKDSKHQFSQFSKLSVTVSRGLGLFIVTSALPHKSMLIRDGEDSSIQRSRATCLEDNVRGHTAELQLQEQQEEGESTYTLRVTCREKFFACPLGLLFWWKEGRDGEMGDIL